MLFVKIIAGKAVAATTDDRSHESRFRHECRWDWPTFARAEEVAAQLNEYAAKDANGRLPRYLATDSGPGCYPRYDVIEAPQVGDPVSYGFNGDYYPDGTVTYVTPGSCYLVRTSTGNTYRRRANSAHWAQPGGTWALVPGHHEERNPHI